ncbi:uncharacterized protein PFL1_00625 [Pseudozyma flocculosa PF-1]|uniref:Related to MRP10 - mitochondrial ribosomal protein of the small subunit n=1 Tax=Pseudozyma flocculosa TaxID=84751 RepID=A0A5C3ESV2_9BASI|nr:uncharacterized protein PFL1_00625 [Pseudozyma flocculosa PF-1]EPQ32429.1 hypothetical protein PFL1_00625 [Pseudozyma flocculosa PF-1]SPO34587.1 related to MRP10 - mitochondrial ribosomal protein of the small subunit [Pseudozyma flocculosa]
MKLNKLKVRPSKDLAAAPCAAEFATMLACWASSNDLSNVGQCRESAKALQVCMASNKGRRVTSKPTVNYHLARLSKHL